MRMHADEVEIDALLVRRLLAAQFPDWADLPVEPVLPAGTDNRLFRLGDDLVARLPRRERNAPRLAKERLWLPILAPQLPLVVPAPVATGEPGGGYPFAWAVYAWLDGETATPEHLGDLDRAAADLAGFVGALQAVDPADGPRPGEHNAWRGCPLARRDESVRAAIASLGSAVDAPAVTAAWAAALAAPGWDRPPVWIHGDLDARNLLVRNGRLAAVLDFGCLGVGDPACDVMAAWKLFPGEARNVFRAAPGVDDSTWARARGWVLSQALIALGYYTLETNAVLVREAERWLAEVLADPG